MVRIAAAAIALAAWLQGVSAYGNELVMLDFWSPTCGPCLQMKPTVQSLISAGYPIRQVDVSREPQLAQQYGVTGIPCFVMLVDGQEVGRIVGSTSANQLVELFRGGRLRGQSPVDHPVEQPTTPPVGNPPEMPSAQPPTAAAPVAAPAPSAIAAVPPDEAAWTQQFDSKLLSCTVRLQVQDASGHSHGTGTIIDAREGEALAITCGHLFRESKGKGPLTIDLYEAGPQGLRVVGTVAGQVISYDLDRDVALVSFRPSRPVCVAPVAARGTAISRGDRAASVGCSNGQDPTVMATRITWLDRYQGPPNIEASGAPVEGRSGGGLFNDQGQLVGVCFAADHEGNKGLYAGLESIHEMLGQLELGGLSAGTGLAAGEALAPAGDAATPATLVRGQEPMSVPVAETAAPPPEALIAANPIEARPQQPRTLEPREQATIEELRKRQAAGYEVVCIIRPKEPGGQSEIITLDGVSQDFIRALADRPDTPQTTMKR